MSKSIPQLSAQTTILDTDIFHINRNNIDYKITGVDLKTAINGTGSDVIYKTSLVIPSASVLTLNANPIQLIAAPDAGYYIEIITSSCKVDFNSSVYTTNCDVVIYTNSATTNQHYITGALNASLSRVVAGTLQTGITSGATQYIKGEAVYIKVDGSDPLAGDSDISIYVSYRLVQEL